MGEIKIKRGTDEDRRDGTLGTPAQGEPIYTTDDKTLFIGDGSTDGGLPACKPPVCVTMYNTASQNINASATGNLVEFNLHSPAFGVATSGTDEDITHSTSTNKHLITINTAGTYCDVCKRECERDLGQLRLVGTESCDSLRPQADQRQRSAVLETAATFVKHQVRMRQLCLFRCSRSRSLLLIHSILMLTGKVRRVLR